MVNLSVRGRREFAENVFFLCRRFRVKRFGFVELGFVESGSARFSGFET